MSARTRGTTRRTSAGRWIQRVVIAAILIGAMSYAFGQGTRLWPVGAALIDAFQQAEPRAYDPSAPVRIVAIDGESLARFGQWPWPRPYIGELVERLTALGAASITLDILFAEPDRTSPEMLTEQQRRFDADATPVIRLTENTLHDAQFARLLARANVVISALPRRAADAAEPPQMRTKNGMSFIGSDPTSALGAISALDKPLSIFIDNAAGYGLGGVDLSTGGVVRRAPLFARVGEGIAPALSMEALRTAQGADGYALRSSDSSGDASGGAEPALTAARNGNLILPLSPDGGFWIRFAGAEPRRFVPAWRVLESRPDDAALRALIAGQIVLVGATAPGLARPVQTPLGGAVMPTEVHAEVLEQALLGDWLSRPDWAPAAEALTALALGLIAALAAGRGSALVGGAVCAALPVAALAGSWEAFRDAGLILDPTAAIGATLALYTALTAGNYLRSRRESGAVRAQFERFVAPDVIRELTDDPEAHLTMRGRQRALTVLFSDARGFTTMSESMPPDALIAYLNTCFAELTEAVLETGGTVDKYMGDCIMAFWNAPLEAADHVDRALRAGFAIRAAQERLNAGFAAAGAPPVDFGVGLNTGPCSVGLMGSPRRLEYSCVGDTVNVAARLQDQTKTYGVWNVVGDPVAQAARGWTMAALDEAEIRGRSATMTVWTALAPPGETLTRGAASFRDALEEVRARIVEPKPPLDALDALSKARAPGIDGSKLAALYAGRCGAV